MVFCHNDLTVGNILSLPGGLMAIDYEFSCYNYRGFDLGLHFSEQMFNNNTSEYPFFEYNYDKYPSKEFQLGFFSSYIDQFKQNVLIKSMDSHPGLEKLDADSLYYETNLFALYALLQAVLWAVCQSVESCREFGYLVNICC